MEIMKCGLGRALGVTRAPKALCKGSARGGQGNWHWSQTDRRVLINLAFGKAHSGLLLTAQVSLLKVPLQSGWVCPGR